MKGTVMQLVIWFRSIIDGFISLFPKRHFKDTDIPTQNQCDAFADYWERHWSRFIIKTGDFLWFERIASPVVYVEKLVYAGHEFWKAFIEVVVTFLWLVLTLVGGAIGSVWWCIATLYHGVFCAIYGPIKRDLKVIEQVRKPRFSNMHKSKEQEVQQ